MGSLGHIAIVKLASRVLDLIENRLFPHRKDQIEGILGTLDKIALIVVPIVVIGFFLLIMFVEP
jgi:hypothetical protein